MIILDLDAGGLEYVDIPFWDLMIMVQNFT